MPLSIVFMGTPDFSVPCLNALIQAGENVTAVFTQPDKPKGRGMKLLPPPVKIAATGAEIPVFQPQKLRGNDEVFETLKDLNPDLIIVVAYGQILPKNILELPKHGCVNIHASLLPKYRGAAPIQRCILEGETETGITSMLMEEGLDTGDMLIKSKISIGENETAAELHDRLSALGADVLLRTVAAIKDGSLTPEKQDGNAATYAHMITKEMSKIDFGRTALEVHNQIRSITGYTVFNGKRLKAYSSKVSDKNNGGALEFVCGDGKSVVFLEVQAEGGKRMSAADFIRGMKNN